MVFTFIFRILEEVSRVVSLHRSVELQQKADDEKRVHYRVNHKYNCETRAKILCGCKFSTKP